MSKLLTISSTLHAYGELSVPNDLEGDALRAHVRQAFEDGEVTMAPDWGTEHAVQIDGEPPLAVYDTPQRYLVQVLLPDYLTGSDGIQGIETLEVFAMTKEAAAKEAHAQVAERCNALANDFLVLGVFVIEGGRMVHHQLY